MIELISSFDFSYIFIFLLVMLGAIIALTNDFVVITIYFSIFSFLSAITYLILGAVDVAITEAAVGAALSTIFILTAIGKIGDRTSDDLKVRSLGALILQQPVNIIAALLPACMLIYAATDLPEFGVGQMILDNNIAKFYIENSGEQIGIESVVTSILASYRGFDTMLESLVIFTAAISVYSISKMIKK